MSTDFQAPVDEQLFILSINGSIGAARTVCGAAHVDADLGRSILEESGRLASGVFAPINQLGDREGAKWTANGVQHPVGFAEAYAAYCDGGWAALGADEAFGGQSLPFAVSIAVGEQFAAANMALSLCMVLSSGAVEAIAAYASDDLKARYLPKLVTGEWTGTMNLTEPQAGSDVGALRTMAIPAEDGTWWVSGSKIFITWGEHELASNIVHLVLARTPEAPSGTKGLSLFIVPKFLPDETGLPGKRNDLQCVSIEHKLGIHASPTCTMSFGDNGQCVGWLVGEVSGGMRAMFAMMNHARLSIGLEGVAIAERAYQAAVAYARERVQSPPAEGGAPVRIIEHPDVRRMLMTMRAITQGIRAVVYRNAAEIDGSRLLEANEGRHAARLMADLLTPISKAYATDMGVEVASLAIQVFGGMGFIEETGVAQHYRDIRIAPIYEGTNGIQALDLVGRKLIADDGAAWKALFSEMREAAAMAEGIDRLASSGRDLQHASSVLEDATRQILNLTRRDGAAVATPYLRMFGIILAAHLLLRQALKACEMIEIVEHDRQFADAKIATASFFIENILPEAIAKSGLILSANADRLFLISEDQL